MPEFAQVDVKDIRSDTARFNFSEDNIDALADVILQGNGIVRPLILKQVSIDTYEVLDGHFEYHASVRAREKDPRKAEMVSAFIVKSSEEELVRKQLELLGSLRGTPGNTTASLSVHTSENPASNSDWIMSFERRLGDIREELFQTKNSANSRLNALENRFVDQGSLLELLNKLEVDRLSVYLSQYGVSQCEKHAKAICEARKSKKFIDYRDVVKSVKGLGDKTMLSIIDGWSRINQH
jgi:hypothetical protein